MNISDLIPTLSTFYCELLPTETKGTLVPNIIARKYEKNVCHVIFYNIFNSNKNLALKKTTLSKPLYL